MAKNKLNNLKQNHEKSACERFILLYNTATSNQLKFIRLGDPNIKEPDCICNDNVAIELVNDFDNSYQAEKLWSEARGKPNMAQPTFLLKSLSDLQQIITNKLGKLNTGNYDGFSGKLLLVCHLQSPLLTDHEVELYLENYVPFREDVSFERYFDEIWISWKSENSGEWQIRKLE